MTLIKPPNYKAGATPCVTVQIRNDRAYKHKLTGKKYHSFRIYGTDLEAAAKLLCDAVQGGSK